MVSYPLYTAPMQLDQNEVTALLKGLLAIIDNTRYPLSPRVQLLRRIRSKLPGARRHRLAPARPDQRSATRAAGPALDHGGIGDRRAVNSLLIKPACWHALRRTLSGKRRVQVSARVGLSIVAAIH